MVLKEYWPRYLQELIEFQQIANAEQPEFENAVSDVKSAADDFFLVSLSEYGCERWEKILGLSAAPGDTVQDRRDRILIGPVGGHLTLILLLFLGTEIGEPCEQNDDDADTY